MHQVFLLFPQLLLGFLLSVSPGQEHLGGQLTVPQELKGPLEPGGSLHEDLKLRAQCPSDTGLDVRIPGLSVLLRERGPLEYVPLCASVSPAGRCWWGDSHLP